MNSPRRTFLKQLGFGAAATGLGLFSPVSNCEAALFPRSRHLPRSTPEAQGVASVGILAFLEALEGSPHEFHSLMMLRHGHVVAEGWWAPYWPELNHMLYSLSKSFTSTAVGFAVVEGRLKTEDRVISFFPEDLPASVSDHLAALRVRDLLSMSVGHAEDSTGAITKTDNWVRTFLSLPIKNQPGTAFLYNSGATYMCSAIVQKVTGQKVIDFLRPRLFGPLGISGMTWETCPRGINTGGWGLAIQSEGLAKFGQLYLQKGAWGGRQILPASWVEEATSFKIQQPGANLEMLKKNSDWHQGYCYQFWRCRNNGFRGDGAFGQFTIVLPEQDAVIVITSESPSMQGQLDLVWKHLLPAMQGAPLSADSGAQAQLKHKLATLTLAPPKGQAIPPAAAAMAGKRFRLEQNSLGAQSVSFDFKKHACVFTLQDSKCEHRIQCGLGSWVEGRTSMPGTPPRLTAGELGPNQRIAAAGAWKDANTFEMAWRFHETPHHDIVTCRFDGNQVKIEFLNSLTRRLMPNRKEARPVLSGTA